MTNRFDIPLHPDDVRWAAAEGVSETVIAAVLLLHERSVKEIAAELSAAELEQVIKLVGRSPRVYPPGTLDALKQRRALVSPEPPRRSGDSTRSDVAAEKQHAGTPGADPRGQPETPACGPGSRVRQAAAEGVSETGVERDRVPSSGSRPTISGRSYTGPSKPEARRCRSGSTRGSRPGTETHQERREAHGICMPAPRQCPAFDRIIHLLFLRAQTQRRRARAGDQARLILSGQLTQVLRSFRRSYLR